MNEINLPSPPTGLQRLLYRAPIWLYRFGLGWLLGGRFLLLNHTGRKSGLPRQAVVEVVRHDPASGGRLIASGFGEKADWLRNLMHDPETTIQVGRQRLRVCAQLLTSEQGGAEMVDYARRNPRAARALSRLLGYPVDGSDASYRTVGAAIPFVWLVPYPEEDHRTT